MQKKSIQSVVGCIKGSKNTLHQFSLNYPVWMLSKRKFIANGGKNPSPLSDNKSVYKRDFSKNYLEIFF